MVIDAFHKVLSGWTPVFVLENTPEDKARKNNYGSDYFYYPDTGYSDYSSPSYNGYPLGYARQGPEIVIYRLHGDACS